MDYKLSNESTIKSSEREERQRLSAVEVVISRDNAKLLDDDNNLELFKEAVQLIHRNRCKTALRRKAPAVELLHVYDQRVPRSICKKIEVGGMSQSASVIESVNVEEDQEVCDQCQIEEATSRQGDSS